MTSGISALFLEKGGGGMTKLYNVEKKMYEGISHVYLKEDL